MGNNETSSGGIEISAVEKKIRELWQDKAESVQSGQAVTRTRVLNLIVYAPGSDTETLVGIVAGVGSDHPGRSQILVPQPEAGEDSISAEVTNVCHVAGAGRQQVCGEQVVITARGKRVDQLPSAVRPLLVPDLETALWWRARPDLENPVFEELVDTARRVIVDSAHYRRPARGLSALARFVEPRTDRNAFSDLAWTRMSAFRRQVSALYDVPDLRPHLDRVGHVEIVCGRGPQQEGIPGQALLAAGWFSSRLGWAPQGHFEHPDANTAQVALEAGGRPVQIVVRVTAPQPGLSSIKLVAGGDRPATFEAALSDDRSHVQQHIRVGDKSRAGKIQRFYQRDEGFLLARELEILGHDRVYEQSLAAVPGLVG